METNLDQLTKPQRQYFPKKLSRFTVNSSNISCIQPGCFAGVPHSLEPLDNKILASKIIVIEVRIWDNAFAIHRCDFQIKINWLKLFNSNMHSVLSLVCLNVCACVLCMILMNDVVKNLSLSVLKSKQTMVLWNENNKRWGLEMQGRGGRGQLPMICAVKC